MARRVLSALPASRRGGYVLAGLGAVLFSIKGILIKLAYGDAGGAPEVDAITLLALRMVFSLPFYVVIGAIAWRARAAQGLPPPSGRQIAMAAFLGVLGYYCAAYLDFAGLQYLSAQFERLILMTYPLFVTLLGVLFFGGRLTLWGLAALLLSYGGVVFIFAAGATARGEHALLGSALVFGASFTFALYQLMAGPLVAQIGARVFTSIAMLAACAAVLAHFVAGNSLLQLAGAPPRVIALAAVMAVTSTVLPSFMLSTALERVGAQAVSMIGTVSPSATIVMAMAILGEPFTAADAVGTALVVAGVGLFTWNDGRRS